MRITSLAPLVFAITIVGSSSRANVVFVNKAATGANTGASWVDAFAELRDALVVAHAGDELWIAAGTYTPATSAQSFILRGQSLYGGFVGGEVSRDARDWAMHPVVLSGDINGDDVGFGGADNCRHVLVAQSSPSQSKMDGFIVEGGVALGSGSDGQGAGLSCETLSQVFALNCIFRRNQAVRGAATYVSAGSVAMHGCLIAGNAAQDCAGVFRVGDSYVAVFNCTIVNNSQTGHSVGCAIYDEQPIDTDVGNSIIWGNSPPQITGAFVSGQRNCVEGGGGDISSNPQFVSPSTGDFRLSAGSACIDQGYNSWALSYLSRDLAGVPRRLDDPSAPNYQGTEQVDIGAYEFTPDCDGNGIADIEDVAQGLGTDLNGDTILDACQQVTPTFCFGDGTGAACPCGNVGASRSGCGNSVGHAGRLFAFGVSTLAHESLVLHLEGVGSGASALYFQGDGLDLVGGYNGLPFGDGLRCVFGTTIRLATKTSINGQSAFGSGVPGDARVSVRGSIPPFGGTRYYQAWYRDAATFCTPSRFNTSNAVQVQWTP